MFEITPIKSGSSGNAYLIKENSTSILIECGMPFKKLKEWFLKNKMSLININGCLVSHEHSDHIKCAQNLIDYGVNVYTSEGTIKAAGLRWANKMRPYIDIKKSTRIGKLNVYAFEVSHDAAEPFAFLIDSDEDRLLYITDTGGFSYTFDSVTHLMIEANYDSDIMRKNVQDGLLDEPLAGRIMSTHMSVKDVENLLEKMDKTRLRQVWLMHLSDNNSDAEQFLTRIKNLVDCQVFIC